jgi:predicted dehydrogenase
MRQLVQHLRTGNLSKLDAPSPALGPHDIRIQASHSLISAGTERMLMAFGKGNMLNKMRQQPDKVAQVLRKMQTDGVISTLARVRDKLQSDIPLGYCQAGIVQEIGDKVQDIRIGDRVVSNAPHSDEAVTGAHLCAKIPDGVSDEHAVFTVLSSISLHGMRMLKPTLGESIAVIGLGMVGLLAVQLLRAQGCRVLAMDYNSARLRLARLHGAETYDLNAGDPQEFAQEFTASRGIDGVLICAATDSNDPIIQAANMCRMRGRIVLTGVSGLDISRDLFYKKELQFSVSCSYGPGRYDADYESGKLDYPIGYVRWTEQRNFTAILELMREKKIDVSPLISHRFSFDDVEQAYQLLLSDDPSLGILISYPHNPAADIYHKTPTRIYHTPLAPENKRIGFIGAGNFATSTLMQAFTHAGGEIAMICSKSGTSAAQAARKFNAAAATSSIDDLLAREDIPTIVIATPHHTHAPFIVRALEAGKHVFVEKPMAIDEAGLAAIQHAYENAQNGLQLMVGFNRRFAPHFIAAQQAFSAMKLPMHINMQINAGLLPANHWTRDASIGGGRIIGEACHFIDLACALAGSEITQYHASGLGGAHGKDGMDGASITLRFDNGSLASIQYIPCGNARIPKERINIHAGGKSVLIENFKTLRNYGIKLPVKKRLYKPDKGHNACVKAFMDGLQSGKPAIDIDALFYSSMVTLSIAKQLRQGQ